MMDVAQTQEAAAAAAAAVAAAAVAEITFVRSGDGMDGEGVGEALLMIAHSGAREGRRKSSVDSCRTVCCPASLDRPSLAGALSGCQLLKRESVRMRPWLTSLIEAGKACCSKFYRGVVGNYSISCLST